MPSRTPSDEDCERAIQFLRTRRSKKVADGSGGETAEGTDFVRIYRALRHSDVPLSAYGISRRMGGACNANNVSSRLAEMAAWGLVYRAGTTFNPVTLKNVTAWDLVVDVPRHFIKAAVPAYYAVLSEDMQTIVYGELINHDVPEQREHIARSFPGQSIVRLVRKDLKLKTRSSKRRAPGGTLR